MPNSICKIGIVAHTKRAKAAHKLRETVHAAYTTIDSGTLGCRGNHLKAWTWLREHNHNGYSVVIEDDAVPVADFNKHLDEVLALAPTPVVSLYLGKLRPPQYQAWIKYATERADLAEPPASWIISPDLFHAVGVCIRHDLVADMLDSIKDLTSIGGDMMPTPAPIDQAISWWAKEREHQISYCFPSILDHADGETVEQHADGQPREPGRVAWRTGVREPWTTSKVSM